ncbi:phage portal protein [Micromonospora craniellae]|uniref:Phage portal protein n=1 Tax=Micromonospora craniellae TaxID=2294034 RepID=A0A372G1T7_9ACTN|nr:phage portal protein [Micromonospora craniellae]QOC89873.1 phage portal protein [Micromonospora craniellae]RFS47017.1 phage portal protein [Micromonospora craniellae]
MVAFATLAELGEHLASRPGVEVVDPGVPLSEYAASDVSAHNVWKSQPSVRKVVDFIARNVASVPMHLYERASDTDRRRVTAHPLAATLRAPRPRLTPFRFWHSVVVDWMLYDRWCVAKLPTDDGMELVRIPARRFRLKADALDWPIAVKIRDRHGRWQEFPTADFLFDHGYAGRGANGTSPMQTLRDTLAESREAVAYRRQVWANGARVPLVLRRPADAPDWNKNGGRDRFTASWRRFMRGGGREGGTPLLEDGMDLVKVEAFTPRDTLDLEGRKLTDAEVAAAYHIAPELVGAREGNYSNLDAFRQMLWNVSLGPYILPLEQVTNVMLVPDFDDELLYVEAHVDAKLRGSWLEQAQYLQSAVGAPYMLRNEARGRLNLEAIEGGDELVTPLNVLVGGLASPRDTAPKAGGRRGVKASRPEDLADYDRELAGLTEALTAYAQRQADTLLDRLGAKAEDGAPDLWALWGAEQPEREQQLAALVLSWALRLAAVGAWEVLSIWNPDGDGWSAEVMTAWLAKAAAAHAHEVEQGGYDAAIGAISGAAGDPDRTWRDALQTALAAWVVRAAAHAVGVATEARNFGGHDAAKASGLGEKTWRTRSSNPRPSHRVLDGQTVPINDVFGNGGRWPGDPALETDERANCKCSVTYARGDD